MKPALEVVAQSVENDGVDFSAIVEEIVAIGCPEKFERFASELDKEWLDAGLKSSGNATIRRRKLPAEQAIWLAVGMGLFRDRSIVEVVEHLGLVLPGKEGEVRSVAPSAVPQSRRRLGVSPLETIFKKTGLHWAQTAAGNDRWRGLALYGADGTTLRIPDSDENRREFGVHAGKNGVASYPQLRLVILMGLRSHLVGGAAFGPCIGEGTGELALMGGLWEQVPEKSLLIVDKGFTHFGAFHRYQADLRATERHWLVRAKRNLKWKAIAPLGASDSLVEIELSDQARKEDPDLPRTMRARAITYQRPNAEAQTLLTSLIDSAAYPADEIVALYHERWELELGYDEIKTHLLEREEALRSRTVDGVRQEVWGILIAYNLVRRKMLEVAGRAGLAPTRISFRHSLQLIRTFYLVEARTTAPGKIPARIGKLDEMLGLILLPPRRSQRSNPREVKRPAKKYDYKSARSREVSN